MPELLVEGIAKPVNKQMVLFFVVDTSGSMTGARIGAVNSAMEEVIPDLISVSDANPDTEVRIAVLLYSDKASWIVYPPIPVEQFRWRELRVGGMTAFGAACKELNDKLSLIGFSESYAESLNASGKIQMLYGQPIVSSTTVMLPPVIALLSDGQPSEEYKDDLSILKRNEWFKHGVKAAVAIGDEADVEMLTEFTGNIHNVVATRNVEELVNIITDVSNSSALLGMREGNAITVDRDSIVFNQEKESFSPRNLTWDKFSDMF